MHQPEGQSPAGARLAEQQDLILGPIVVSPATRTISGFGGRAVLEPQMMRVLLCLAEQEGRLVTRSYLLDRCWNGTPVGDDSLNRAIAGIRRAAREAVGDALRVETVAGAGYTLSCPGAGQFGGDGSQYGTTEEAMAAGWRSWRLGLPEPDRPAIQRLRSIIDEDPTRANAWALLALLLRHGAEHADAADCARYVDECQAAAHRCLAIDPGQGVARTALISLPPLFGDWLPRRSRLLEILDEQPENQPATHDLAILEMATGRPSAAGPLIESLMQREPLAAIFHYKRVYHLWTSGRLSEMDRIADRAMQLWPRHPAIWFARFWSLAFTGRPQQADQQLADNAARPTIPGPAFVALEKTVKSLVEPGNDEARKAAVLANVEAAKRGPAQSVAAIIQLSGIGAVDEAFDVAEAYFERRGATAISQRKTSTDPSITDQHRRVTQMLFIPATRPLRASPRFADLCEATGLQDYWHRAQLSPDR